MCGRNWLMHGTGDAEEEHALPLLYITVME